MRTLCMKDPLIFSTPVFRSNLYYDVWFLEAIDEPFKHLQKFILETLDGQDKSVPKVIV